MTKSRGILPPRKIWSDADLRLLTMSYPDHNAAGIAASLGVSIAIVYAKAHSLGLKKSEAFKHSSASGRLQPGAGKDTRFKKGQVPANKGLRRPGWARGRMKETQFKKGGLSGRALQLMQLIGTERVSKDGYLERKINNDMPFHRRWRAVHLVDWEAVNGPLPKGHCLAFRDRDKTNGSLKNLELITLAERMRRNSYHTNYPKDVAQLIQLKGALIRKINRKLRDDKEQSQ